MGIIEHRQDQATLVTANERIETQQSFHHPPAIVGLPSRERSRRHVDFFAAVLSHVGDVEIAGGPVERKPPGVAKSQAPDLGESAGKNEGIDTFVGAGTPRPGVEPQQFAEFRREFLPMVVGVAAPAPVADSSIEASVWPECQHASIVVGMARVVDGLQHCQGGLIGLVGVAHAPLQTGDDQVADGVCVKDIHSSVAGVIRIEREPQQPLFTTCGNLAVQIEEWRGKDGSCARHYDTDEPFFFNDKQPCVVAGRCRHEDGEREAVCHESEGDGMAGGKIVRQVRRTPATGCHAGNQAQKKKPCRTC